MTHVGEHDPANCEVCAARENRIREREQVDPIEKKKLIDHQEKYSQLVTDYAFHHLIKSLAAAGIVFGDSAQEGLHSALETFFRGEKLGF